MNQQTYTTEFGGKELSISIGGIAQAANAAVTVRMGDTIVLVTAVMGKQDMSHMGFFPLMVEYEERLYAGGRIKGSRFIKREGRPSDEAVLIGRFIDRAIRPLFDTRLRREVQIIATTLSFDESNDPDILALIGASCALHMSDIPWHGPIGAVRVSQANDALVYNPTYEERQTTKFDLDIAGDTEKVVMIEARAEEASESELIEAFQKGREALAPVIALLNKIRTEAGKEKQDLFTPKDEIAQEKQKRHADFLTIAQEIIETGMDELFYAQPLATKGERGYAKSEIEKRIATKLEEKDATSDEINTISKQAYDLIQTAVSERILKTGQRLDGRAIDEVRSLQVEVGVLPRVHGTGLFARGETQVLSVCTLGAPGDQQTLDSLESVGEKRYMHHYNFPPFSVGESKPMRGPGRREIGHGALAEKALEGMMPSKEEFPYAVRVVSEVLNSNGSSSMASTCGSTLALMDAGVPIKAPVAGIAMGLASNENGTWKVITDLQDLEDGPGGMDFKITGSAKGITAIQMDTKTRGLNHDIIVEALTSGATARQSILTQMLATIAQPRPELSPYAPRILKLNIHPDKIRDVIGPGGKMINEIIASTGVEAIDIEQDGLVMITAKDQAAGQKAYDWIHNLTRDVQVGEVFEGPVVRIMDFGAFINILPGKDGMVHISELAPWRVGKVEDIVKVGDKVHVKVIEIDDMGRVNLSMKRAEGNVYPEKPAESTQGASPQSPQHSSKPKNRPFQRNVK